MLTCLGFSLIYGKRVCSYGRLVFYCQNIFTRGFLAANSSVVSSKWICRSLSFFTQRMLSQTAVLVILLNVAHFWFFSALKMISHQNSLWPSNKNNLEIVSTFGKTACDFYAHLWPIRLARVQNRWRHNPSFPRFEDQSHPEGVRTQAGRTCFRLHSFVEL